MLAEYQSFRLCGILLLALALVLVGIVMAITLRPMMKAYHPFIVIGMVIYTFYAIAISIYDLVRYRRYERPTFTAARLIRFTAALVSLLSLQAVILIQCGGSKSLQRWLNGITGSGVCIAVLIMAGYMLIKSHRVIKKIKGKR